MEDRRSDVTGRIAVEFFAASQTAAARGGAWRLHVFDTSHPVYYAGSFNFTFDLGAGFEWYRSGNQSVRVQYRYHHISNHETAMYNPGIDNGVLQVAYVFGR